MVLEALYASDRFSTVAQLRAALRARGVAVAATTIYRSLYRLVEAGTVHRLNGPEDIAVYRLCTKAQAHHHLVCRRCGHAEEIVDGAIETWVHSVAREYEFAATPTTIAAFGTCRTCTQRESARGT